uniref:Uncharacterized protein n=1 Tax=Glossina pallidipes TaxID=7398 RepID=A0A1A9ZBT3_GLOPL
MDEEATATEKTTTLDGVTIEYIDASEAGVEDETNLNVDVCRDDADDCVKGDVVNGVDNNELQTFKCSSIDDDEVDSFYDNDDGIDLVFTYDDDDDDDDDVGLCI